MSMVGPSNVAQAGDSASTVMDASASNSCHIGHNSITGGGGAAPSILSNISANTTTNFFMMPRSCDDEASGKNGSRRTSHGRRHRRRRYEASSGDEGDEDGDEDEEELYDDEGASREDVDGEEDCMDAHNYIVNGGRNSVMNGSDPRLDSVSAIITARKMSAHAKGVTFSIGSASSQSRDHISLNLDDPILSTTDNSEVCSAASLSGVSVSCVSVSGTSATVGGPGSS